MQELDCDSKVTVFWLVHVHKFWLLAKSTRVEQSTLHVGFVETTGNLFSPGKIPPLITNSESALKAAAPGNCCLIAAIGSGTHFLLNSAAKQLEYEYLIYVSMKVGLVGEFRCSIATWLLDWCWLWCYRC